MLSRPEHGCTRFQLDGGDTRYILGYLTDVANEWLVQAIHGLRTLDVFAVHGYCEPGRLVCTVSYWSCYLFFETDDMAPDCRGMQQVHVTMLDFCRMLYRDISENLDAWVHWDEGTLKRQGAEAAARREKEIRQKIGELKSLIEEKEKFFDESHGFF